MTIKERLSEKITSEGDLERAVGYLDYSKQALPFGNPNNPWWVLREQARIRYGVYPAHSDVSRKLADALPWTGLHVSVEDPNLVAYTVDRANGEADRQVRTTLGRFLQKWYPSMPDSMLQNLVAEHAAEISTELELLSGQAIVDFYRSGVTGSCMTHEAAHWESAKLEGHHPAEVYDMPNIYLAVVRDGGGKIVGRSLVYHASETDKRYIRCYGTPSLQKKLVRLGYKAGTWVGAKFKAIKLAPLSGQDTQQVRYVMPYLDGAGGSGDQNRSNVALLGGELLSVSRDIRSHLTLAGEIVPCCTNTSGYALFTDVDATKYMQTCPLTGASGYTWEDTWVKAYHQGQVVLVQEEAVSTWVSVEYHGSWVWAAPTEAIYHRKIATIENLEYYGLVRLSPEHYPDNQEYLPIGELVKIDGQWFKREDTVTLITDVGGVRQMVNKRVGQRDPSWVRLAPSDGLTLYTDHPEWVVRTPSKAKVIPNFHAVRLCWDGQWDFSRNLQNVRFWKMNFLMHRKESLGPKFVDAAFQQLLDRSGSDVEAAVVDVLRTVQSYSTRSGGTRSYIDGATKYEDCLRYFKEACSEQHPASPLHTRYQRYVAEATALDYSCPEAQGGSANTWQAPPEQPDSYGLMLKDRIKLRNRLPDEPKFSSWFSRRNTDFADRQDFCEAFAQVVCSPVADADNYDACIAWAFEELATRYDRLLSKEAAQNAVAAEEIQQPVPAVAVD